MATDPFDDLLELENDFYQEGFEAGVSDSAYAGLIEGKLFGVEKGYQKAVELGRLQGRALVWECRNSASSTEMSKSVKQSTDLPESKLVVAEVTPEGLVLDDSIGQLGEEHTKSSRSSALENVRTDMSQMPKNSRLQKHIESLLALTDPDTIPKDNSDASVTEFDDRIAKANAKAKVIANIAGEPLNTTAGPGSKNAGIEDATGLNARQ